MTKILWTVIVAFIVNIVVYFGSKYFDPSIAEDIKFVVSAANVLVAATLLHFYGQGAVRTLRVAIRNLNK